MSRLNCFFNLPPIGQWQLSWRSSFTLVRAPQFSQLQSFDDAGSTCSGLARSFADQQAPAILHVTQGVIVHVIILQLKPRISTSHVARHSWRLPTPNTGEASKQTSRQPSSRIPANRPQISLSYLVSTPPILVIVTLQRSVLISSRRLGNNPASAPLRNQKARNHIPIHNGYFCTSSMTYHMHRV
jgi:hypothetical protein